jgi:hypothetical protein
LEKTLKLPIHTKKGWLAAVCSARQTAAMLKHQTLLHHFSQKDNHRFNASSKKEVLDSKTLPPPTPVDLTDKLIHKLKTKCSDQWWFNW